MFVGAVVNALLMRTKGIALLLARRGELTVLDMVEALEELGVGVAKELEREMDESALSARAVLPVSDPES